MPPEEELPDARPPQASGDFRLTPEQDAALRAIGELHATPLESFATAVHFESGSDLLRYLHSEPLIAQRWAFRGHANAEWRLEPLIYRLQHAYAHSFRSDAEEYVRRAFKRRAHHYVRDLPANEDELEWLALMRHHGAPTRLLDWTRSPYVAAFFATADAKEDEASAIWAIDIKAVRQEAITVLSEEGSIFPPAGADFSLSDRAVFNTVFMPGSQPAIVAPVQPFRTNERVTSQQGIFLCPNYLPYGFEFGLKMLLKSDQRRVEEWSRDHVPMTGPVKLERLFKLHIAPQARREILRELHRMNINYATLFPGLDGFARSLNTSLTMSEDLLLFDDEPDFRI